MSVVCLTKRSLINETTDFFIRQLGFHVLLISPADAPQLVRLGGPASITLRAVDDDEMNEKQSTVCIEIDDDERHDQVIEAPNGVRVQFVRAPQMNLPENQFAHDLNVSKFDADAFGDGRAGMRYRDLIADRQGGRWIASHIRIDDAGDVPDYVHFHQVRFQMIYCYRGAVTVVYEAQGEPFQLSAGDLVLQPPEIRHRVLRNDAGLEVIELGCPAVHDTFGAPSMTLPSAAIEPSRKWSGQRFVRFEASKSTTEWTSWRGCDVLVEREMGICDATQRLAAVSTLRRTSTSSSLQVKHEDGELFFLFVLSGSVDVNEQQLSARDSVSVRSNFSSNWTNISPEFEALLVTVPANLKIAVKLKQ